MELLIRGDDLGYSEAVNYGIEKTVKEGLVGSVGVMPNMPSVRHGLKLLEGSGVCLGQHTNVCLGKPCANPARIPSLLDENGNFKSSKVYWEAFQRGEDFVVLEEAVLEIEAQYFRFKELTGREPGYFEAHAVMSANLYRGLELVAKQHHLRYCNVSPANAEGDFDGRKVAMCKMQSMLPDYDPERSLKEAVKGGYTDRPNIFVCHPGYLDAYILRTSSLTINRTKEVEMLCDEEIQQWLTKQGVKLITFDEIL